MKVTGELRSLKEGPEMFILISVSANLEKSLYEHHVHQSLSKVKHMQIL